ncbi:MAG: hypothetical protein KAS72_06340 [Phycisphaerales bacterium]|nr:hypothetical protein [Phycisphaerales bacterium]
MPDTATNEKNAEPRFGLGTSSKDDQSVYYGPAESLTDLQQAYGLAYHKYLERKLVKPTPGGVFFTMQHLLPESVTFVGRLGSTAFTTLSVVMDSPAGLPLDNVFGDELARFRDRGMVLGELGLFADRRRSVTQSLSAMQRLFRFAYWYYLSNNYGCGVIGVHPRHSGFYQRLFGWTSTGIVRDHPTVRNAPAELLVLEEANFDEVSRRSRYVRQWFEQPILDSFWEMRYRPSIADIVALTTAHADPEMLDRVLPYYRTAEQIQAEHAAETRTERTDIRRAG